MTPPGMAGKLWSGVASAVSKVGGARIAKAVFFRKLAELRKKAPVSGVGRLVESEIDKQVALNEAEARERLARADREQRLAEQEAPDSPMMRERLENLRADTELKRSEARVNDANAEATLLRARAETEERVLAALARVHAEGGMFYPGESQQLRIREMNDGGQGLLPPETKT